MSINIIFRVLSDKYLESIIYIVSIATYIDLEMFFDAIVEVPNIDFHFKSFCLCYQYYEFHYYLYF